MEGTGRGSPGWWPWGLTCPIRDQARGHKSKLVLIGLRPLRSSVWPHASAAFGNLAVQPEDTRALREAQRSFRGHRAEQALQRHLDVLPQDMAVLISSPSRG